MPVLTRGAAARLRANEGEASVGEGTSLLETLGLRESVTRLGCDVWTARAGIDAYTGKSRAQVDASVPQVDHVLEVQLAEHALIYAVNATHTSAARPSLSTACGAQRLREALNGVSNLNVTSKRVNQAKRGPFTAAMNRVRAAETRGSMRLVTLEQLARQGKARWLVDDGTWAKIEREVVCSYDALAATMCDGAGGMPVADALVGETVEDLGVMLGRLGVL